MKKLKWFSAVVAGILGVVFLVALFSSCADDFGKMTPQQISAQVCLPTQAAITVLAAPGILDPVAKAELDAAIPVVDAVCTAGQIVDITNLHNLAAAGLPAILKVVAVAPLPSEDKRVAAIGVSVAQAVLAQIIAQNTVQAPSPAETISK